MARPLPGLGIPPASYRRAVERGTRTADGRPGPRYWTNHSRYDIQAELDLATGLITGSETIVYQNNSPDTLPSSSSICTSTCTGRARSGTRRRRSPAASS